MKFIDALKNTVWKDVKKSMLFHYPSEEKSIDGYEKVYRELHKLEPEISDRLQIYIGVNEHGRDVSGYSNKEKIYYAIEYTPWERWLGYEIHEDMANFATEDIVADCLWEMTWGGFDQVKIQNQMNELKGSYEKAVEEIMKQSH